MEVPKSLCTVTGNDIIRHFQSATNSVNASGATANFSVRYLFSIRPIYENATASNFKIFHNVAHNSLYISTGNDIAKGKTL